MILTPTRRLLAALGAAALLLGACASDDDTDAGEPTTETDGTQDDTADGDDTDDTAAVAVDFSETGPHPVGSTVVDMDGVEVFVFYPADPDQLDEGEHITSFSSDVAFPEDFREIVPDFFVQQLDVDHHADAPASDEGPFSLVLHSHGFSGYPLYATNHLTHTASWGYVVVAPSHPSRNLPSVITQAAAEAETTDLEDLVATLDLVEELNADPDSVLYTLVDTDQIGAEGHSAGGRAVLQLAAQDDRVSTLIGQAPAAPVRLEELVGGGDLSEDERAAALAVALEDVEPPDVPVLLMPGERDGVIPLSAVQTIYDWLDAPKAIIGLANAGHNPFLDICATVRAQGGLIANAGELADVFGDLLLLGEDGCVEGYLEPEAGYAFTRHLTVAWYRWAFGQDDGTASLDSEFLEATFPDATGAIEEDLDQ